MTVRRTIVKAGRGYSVTTNGARDVNLKYQLTLASPLGATELPTSFPGVPEIGTAHPTYSGLYALSYKVEQPDGAAKHTLDIEVLYGPADFTTTGGATTPEIIESCQEWGWDDATGEKDLVTTVETTPKAVVNSAGDPFDTAPQVAYPTPQFTKVIRTKNRKDGYSAYNCCTNSTRVTIGDLVCEPGTLLCTISERKVIGEWRLPYEYTVHLRYRSNIVPDGTHTQQLTEIGWDAAVTDAGMRQIDSTTGKLKLIQVLSEETNTPATVTSPELLDGQGHAVTRASGVAVTPYVLVFPAYTRKEFPTWFYSEPATPTPPSNSSSSQVIINGGD